jgi:hypothetical protein
MDARNGEEDRRLTKFYPFHGRQCSRLVFSLGLSEPTHALPPLLAQFNPVGRTEDSLFCRSGRRNQHMLQRVKECLLEIRVPFGPQLV